MTILLWTLSLLLGAVLLAALARRIGVPSPSLIALGGVFLALLPNGPRISLEPDLALALFVAPVLMDAAFDSSLRDLRKNWLPLVSLVFGAVIVTTWAVAMVARWLVPAMPLAVAVALGAAVAPPDAAAATAVLNEVKLPYRLITVLEGESLLNDASALLIYRLAVVAALAHSGSVISALSTLAFVLIGSVAVGVLFAFVFGSIVDHFSHVPSSIVLQFIGAFGIWILADRLALSGILVIVTGAIVLSRRAGIRMPAAVRVPSYAVWDTVVFLLNALAFIVVGLQLGPITDRLDHAKHLQYITFAIAIFVTVVLARAAWVIAYNLGLRLLNRVLGEHAPNVMHPPPFKRSLLVAWCGMRGLVTLAAALALPDGTSGAPAFPYRDLIVLTAFSVVLATLVVQGFTLRPLVMILDLDADETVEREMQTARAEIFRAALASLGEQDTELAVTVRSEYKGLVARFDGSSARLPEARAAEIALRTVARNAAREALNSLRRTGAIGDAAFQSLESELDLIELEADIQSRW
jgi:CPA1 family monovalent cation:H+ antiporter